MSPHVFFAFLWDINRKPQRQQGRKGMSKDRIQGYSAAGQSADMERGAAEALGETDGE